MNLPSLTDTQNVAQTITAVCLAIASLWGGYRYLWPHVGKFWRMAKCFWDRACGVFHTLEQMPKLLEEWDDRGASINTLKGMVIGLKPMIDQLVAQGIKRTEQLQDQGSNIAAINGKVDLLGSTLSAQNNANPRLATFDTNAKGECTAVNRTYLKWVGMQREDVLGFGWINAIHPDDREHVREEWLAAVREERRFTARYRMLDSSGNAFDVEGTAERIPDAPLPAECWKGFIYRFSNGVLTA